MHPRTHALIQNDYVEIWCPVEVVKAGDDEVAARPLGMIRGITSSEIRDLDGEVILQKGLDWSEALSTGYLTHEHPLGSLNIVGFPQKIMPTTVEKGGKTFSATLLEGALYLDDKVGKSLWDKAVTMQKAGGQRRLGLSIEGKVKPGARKSNGEIDGISVKSVAISSQPRNRTSWWQPVMRGLVMAYDSEHPMQVEPRWLEQALWKAEALGDIDGDAMKAETVGYPMQGVANANGIANLVPQSISGRVSNASHGGKLDVQQNEATFGLDPKSLKGMSTRDLHVARILKKMPALTWAQGLDVLRAFEKTRTPFEVKS